MKILTHNLLQCNVASKHCKGPKYPLEIEAADSTDLEKPSWTYTKTEYEPEFLERLISKINWPVLRKAAEAIQKFDPSIVYPETPPYYQNTTEEAMEISNGPSDLLTVAWCDKNEPNSEKWWKALNTLLFEYEFITGKLICPSCGHIFPITDAIPNMLLREDEI